MGDISSENLPTSASDDEPPIHFYVSQNRKDKDKEKEALSEKNSETSGNFGLGSLSESHAQKLMDRDPDEIQIAQAVETKRGYQDIWFAFLFLMVLVSMISVGIGLAVHGNATLKPIEGRIPDLIFSVLDQADWMIAIFSLVTILFGACLVFFFRFFVKGTVWTTVLATPVFLFCGSIWCFVSYKNPSGELNIGIITLGAICMALACGLAVFIYFMKNRIQVTVVFLRLATEVLKDRPSLFFISVFFSLFYLIFLLAWFWTFSWTFLLGHSDNDQDPPIWVLNAGSFWAISYLVFVYLWVSAVFHYLQSYTLSQVTCHWYFHRDDVSKEKESSSLYALRNAFTKSFGSICLAGLVYSSVRFLQYLIRQLSQWNKNRSCLAWLCIGCLESVAQMLDSVNKFALSYCALSGDSFCKATKISFAIFRRNLLDRSIIDSLSHFVLHIWVAAISVLFALGVFTFVEVHENSKYAAIPAILTFLICYYVLKFYSDLILNMTDAIFLCYAIDCDVNSTLLGNQQTSKNYFAHQTLEALFRVNQNVVVYDVEDA